MKTLKDIIALRGNKYADDAKNPSYTEFWQGYFEGWKNAYRDLKEILEQNGFNLDVPVIDVVKTNADHIRSMTDEELAVFIEDVFEVGRISVFAIYPELTKNRYGMDWLKQPYKEDT